MKKVFILIVGVLLLTGCGNKKITCTYKEESEKYKQNRSLELIYVKDNLASFTSNIKEEYYDESLANDAYIKYQTEYDNYNNNDVLSSYKKDNLIITAIYQIDSDDIKNKKVVFEFDLTKNKDALLKQLKSLGYQCN